MRENLKCYKTSHAGLCLERLVPDLTDDKTKPGKIADLIQEVARWNGGDLYSEAFELFQTRLSNLPNTVLKKLAVRDRVIVGLGAENPMETSITLNRLYGVPVIPGSALKGVARRYAEMLRPEEPQRAEDHAAQIRYLFGDTEFGGRTTFFDAWWVPGDPPLRKDVITVHHQPYYTSKGKIPPTDFDDPNPVSFVSARGEFLFAVQGRTEDWAQLAMALLQGGLYHLGVGAKTSSGYGRFEGRSGQDHREAKAAENLQLAHPAQAAQSVETFAERVQKVPDAEFKIRAGELSDKWKCLPDSPEKKEGAEALLKRVAQHRGFDKKKDGQVKRWVQELRDYLEHH